MYQPISDKRRESLNRGNLPRNAGESAYQYVNDIEPTLGGYRARPYTSLWQDGNTLVDYGTVVAVKQAGVILVSDERYSASTSKHLSILNTQLLAAGYHRHVTSVCASPDGTRGGWNQSGYTPYTAYVLGQPFELPEPVWTSPNGKWTILAVTDGDGTYSHIIMPGWAIYWPSAYVQPNGNVYTIGSVKIPAYVLAAVNELQGR